MQSSRKGTDRAATRMFSRSSRPTPRTKHRRFLQFEPLEHRVVLSTYYVAPSGNDGNAGSASSPFATLQHSMMSLQPGDTLDVEPGTYAGFVAGWDSTPASSGDPYGTIDGTASQPITIQADPSAAPGSVIINSRDNKTVAGIDLEPGCNYITIKGFTVDGTGSTITSTVSRGYGIKINGNYDHVLNNTVENMIGACTAGIHDDGGDYAIIQGNTVTGVQNSNGSTSGHGIYIANCTGVHVIGNDLHDNAYVGIHINGDPNTVQNALIADNVIYNNGQNGIDGDGLQNSTIVNNLIYNYSDFGICLYVIDASGSSVNNIIVNNTIDSGTSSGTSGSIRILDGSTGNTILNNILLDGSSVVYRISADSQSGTVSNYNIVPNRAQVQSEDTGQNESFSQWQSSTGQDHNSFAATAAQLFVNPSASNYQESSTSPSISAGTSTDAPSTDILGNPRPSSNGYDIGCYEYETSTPSAPSVTGETPASGATSVAMSMVPTATFNEAVQSSTISFTLKNSSGSTVAGSVSYNSRTYVTTFTPTSALASNTTYTAAISGAESTSGVSMTAPFSWSFTTAPTPSTISIWSSTAKPANPTDPDTGSVELGVKFYSDVSGSITGLRFYKGSTNTGTHVADLWTSSGTLLATATFTRETGSGWQQVNFATPVAITAGTTYVASYHTNVGHYADDQNYFASQYNSGSLHVPANGGVYAYGAAGSFPTQVWNASNYWVDIVLSPSQGPSVATPAAVALSSAASLQIVSSGSGQAGGLAIPGYGSASATAKLQGKSLNAAQWVPGVAGRLNPVPQSALVKAINRRFMTP